MTKQGHAALLLCLASCGAREPAPMPMGKTLPPAVTAQASAASSSAPAAAPTGLTEDERRHAIASLRGLSPFELANGRDVGAEADTIEGWAKHAKPDERELLEREVRLL